MLPKLAKTATLAANSVKDFLSTPLNSAKQCVPEPTLNADPILGFTYPLDNCCRLYESTQYNGDHCLLCYDENEGYEHFTLSEYGWDNKVDSFVCGKNVSYMMCNGSQTDDCNYDHGNNGAGHT